MNNTNTIIFYPELISITGDKETAMFFAQGIHLQKLVENQKGGYLGGFIKSCREWATEAFFSKYHVEKAKKKLKELGILHTEVVTISKENRSLRGIYGCSPVTKYTYNLEKVKELLAHIPRVLEKLGIMQPKRATTNDKQQPAPTPKEAEKNLSTRELAALAWAKTNTFWAEQITEENVRKALNAGKGFAQQFAVANRKSIDTADKPATNTADKPSTCHRCNSNGMLMFKDEKNQEFAAKCQHSDAQIEMLKNLKLQFIPPRK